MKDNDTNSEIALVAVPLSLHCLYRYSIPSHLLDKISPGSMVEVPFGRGNRTVSAYVLDIITGSIKDLKPVGKVPDLAPVLKPDLLYTARYACFYYLYPPGSTIKCMLPSGLGANDKKAGAKIKKQKYIFPGPEIGNQELQHPLDRDMVATVYQKGQVLRTKFLDCFPGVDHRLRRLVDQGYLKVESGEVVREPYAENIIPPTGQIDHLTEDQAEALKKITIAVQEERFEPILLHGITGSGKTEVYIRAARKCLEMGKGVVVIVPEIALTPQLLNRFLEGLQEPVAVLHSRLSQGEKYDQWRLIQRGEKRLVIGARSAVFAPLSNLGLIIIDEEHETSFKQESQFHYHARSISLIRARHCSAPVVMGTATPDLKSYYYFQQGKYDRIALNSRPGRARMPTVEIVDMRNYKLRKWRKKGKKRDKNGPGPEALISLPLGEAIVETVKADRQVILFLNRRGYSPFLLCPDCGETLKCTRCDISLTYHLRPTRLLCHYCGSSIDLPKQCPQCKGKKIKPVGVGTQQVEDAANMLLKEHHLEAQVARFDSDAINTPRKLYALLGSFARGEIKIMIGTQMLAKGHDFPGVSLVGVILAETGLNFPDFRAAEKTFQMLVQVAGRAGRGSSPGKVLVQTYNPDHYAIKCAQQQDYQKFYQQEIKLRKRLQYPPFCQIILLRIQGQEDEVIRLSQNYGKYLRSLVSRSTGVIMYGPAPSPISRIKDKYRQQILFKLLPGSDFKKLLFDCLKHDRLPSSVKARLSIDVDPDTIL